MDLTPLNREELAILTLVEKGPLAPTRNGKLWESLAQRGLLTPHVGMDGWVKAYELSLLGKQAMQVWKDMKFKAPTPNG